MFLYAGPAILPRDLHVGDEIRVWAGRSWTSVYLNYHSNKTKPNPVLEMERKLAVNV